MAVSVKCSTTPKEITKSNYYYRNDKILVGNFLESPNLILKQYLYIGTYTSIHTDIFYKFFCLSTKQLFHVIEGSLKFRLLHCNTTYKLS